MSNEIRKASIEDLDLIIYFIKQLAKYEKMENQVYLQKKRLKEYLFGDRPMAEVILLLRDNKEVGFALFFHNFSTFEGKPGLYLEDLFVLPEHRGHGLGKSALQYLANLARERDCARFEWVCLDWNQPSIDFYVKQGASPKKEWIIFRMDGENLKNY